MKVVDRVSKIRPIKSWCGLKQALAAATLAFFSVLLMTSPVIAVCQRNITDRQTGQPVSEDHTGNVIQLIHLAHTANTFNTEYGAYSDKDSNYAGTTIALLRNGKVYSWGNNIYGGIGNDTACTMTSNIYLKQPPCYYNQPQDITKYFSNDKVVKLANRSQRAIAITESGKIYRWGQPPLDEDGKDIIRHPTQYQELAPYHIIGYSGTDRGGPGTVGGGWYAYSDDTIFDISDDKVSMIKPQLNEATIRSVDCVWRTKEFQPDNPDKDEGGLYVLTSTNKLLRVQDDGKTTEITNSEIAKRGGFKQIYHYYAIDHQGGLWLYGHPKYEGESTLVDMHPRLVGSIGTNLPALQEFVNSNGVEISTSTKRDPIVRGVDNHFYYLATYYTNESRLMLNPIDITASTKHQNIRLFHGDVGAVNDKTPLEIATDYSNQLFYDYSFIPEGSDTDLVCTTAEGLSMHHEIIGEDPSLNLTPTLPLRRQPKQDKTGDTAPTCVKIPSDKPKPDPIKPPTPNTPNQPGLPGVPNTGSEPDPIVQLVHIPAVINGAINGMAENLTAKDTDYAGTVMALTQSGRVFAWGNNYAGSVGVGTAGFKVPYPEFVKSRREGRPEYYDTPQEITKYFGDDKVVRIGRYGRTSVAVTQSGKLYQWGWSYNPPWDWYDRLKNITWTEPTPDPTPSLNKVTGIGGSYGDTYSGGGWLAHGDDTIFTKTSTSQLKDFGDKLKLSLNGTTIRSVDYVDFNGRVAQVAQQRPQDLDQSFRTGVYILTSTNKLLRVKNDGTTTEVTNDKIKSRGGIRQIANQYAIDNQGGLWYYGVGMSKDQIYDMSLKTLGGITPLPRLRDIVGIDLIEDEHMLDDLQRPWSSSVLVRSIDGHIYDVSPVQTGFSVEDGGYPERRFALTDVTKLLGHDKIKLFDGKIHSEGTKPVDNEAPGLYDYSYVLESKLDTVCTVISGVASANASQAQSLYGHGHPMNVSVTTTKLVNDVFAPTCVKLPPLLTPDPKPSPTPNPKPTKPTSGVKAPFDRLKAPGVPNTGSEPLFISVHLAPIFAQR